MNGKSLRSKRYTTEEKQHILSLLGSGRSKVSLKEEFGVASDTLTRWVEDARNHNSNGSSDTDKEIEHLRYELASAQSENKRLKRERDALYEAVGELCKDMDIIYGALQSLLFD